MKLSDMYSCYIKGLMTTNNFNLAFVYIFILFTMVSLADAYPKAKQLPVPEVTPLAGTPTLNGTSFRLPACSDFVVEEFIVSGTATSYKEIRERDEEGKWYVQKTDKASYTTRIVVLRPNNPKKFNGTVVVEWMNVSGGFDTQPIWQYCNREFQRSGTAYVGVTAQKVGIEGNQGFGLGQAIGEHLKKADPERYGSLNHPGDAFSFDIFSQVGRLIKHSNNSKVLGPLVAKFVIGEGESQSAAYMTTYVNAVDPIAKVFDGFLIFSRFGGSVPLAGIPMMMMRGSTVKMRDDLRVPTLIFVSETDVFGMGGMGGYLGARQPDTERLRVWEIAGTSHGDSYADQVTKIDTCGATYEMLAEAWKPSTYYAPANIKFDKPYNNGPQMHYITESAIAQLIKWVAKGDLPPHGTPLEFTEGDKVQPVLDKHDNIKGGVRSPWVDVPVSSYCGTVTGNLGAMAFGRAEPFDAQKLDSLYPGGKAEYLKKFEVALDKQIKAGFILKADKKEILKVAKLSYKGSL